MAVRLMMASVAYSFYNGFKDSCLKSLGTFFQQAYHPCLEGGEGLGRATGRHWDGASGRVILVPDLSGLSEL